MLHQLKDGNWLDMGDVCEVRANEASKYSPDSKSYVTILIAEADRTFLTLYNSGRSRQSRIVYCETFEEACQYRDELAAIVNGNGLSASDKKFLDAHDAIEKKYEPSVFDSIRRHLASFGIGDVQKPAVGMWPHISPFVYEKSDEVAAEIIKRSHPVPELPKELQPEAEESKPVRFREFT